MIDVMMVSIGIGLAVSLFFSEAFGLAAGGMVVPGYFALYLDRPVDVLLTLLCAFVTYGVVHLLSLFMIIYGKRRTVMMILVGYILRALLDLLPVGVMTSIAELSNHLGGERVDVAVIGYVIPGLVAIWIDRQGVVETICALISASVIVRLLLILIFGASLA